MWRERKRFVLRGWRGFHYENPVISFTSQPDRVGREATSSQFTPDMLIVVAGLAAGLVIGPTMPAQLPAWRIRPSVTHMCDDGADDAASPPAPAPPPSGPSLIEQAKTRGFDLWGALAEPYATAAGVEYEPSAPLGKAAAFELAEINIEQFAALLVSVGDNLPEDKVKEMFTAVDEKGDGKIEFVQCYKAIIDEARSRGSGGGLFGFFGGNKD